MDDKIFNGKGEMFLDDTTTTMPLSEVVADSLQISTVRDASELGPVIHNTIDDMVTRGTNKFNFDMSNMDVNVLNGIFGIDTDCPPYERSVKIITQPEIIYKPKNLKYPNKKRKLRCLKKWKKRFGLIPE